MLLAIAVPKASGQSFTTNMFNIPTCGYDSDGAIGRVASDGKSIISYHYHFLQGEFIYTDYISGNSQQFILKDSIYVYDFERIADTVFFCGVKHGIGVVGFFKESVFAGAGDVYYSTVSQIRSLTKMEVYADSKTGHHIVAAVGEDNIDQSSLTQNTALFIIEFSGTAIYYHYRILCQDYRSRIYQDIAVTDNYIVASGIYDYMSNTMAISVIDKNNLTIFYPSIPIETAGNMNSLSYSITHLKEDDVAISSIVDISSSYFVPVHVFDASSSLFTNSQMFPLVDKSALYNEMKYFPESATLMLLQTSDYPNFGAKNSVFYRLKPYSQSTYPVLITYDTNTYYYSLDQYFDKWMLATGERKTLSHSFMIHDILSEPSFNCLESNTLKILTNTPPNNNPLGNLPFLNGKDTISYNTPQIIKLNNSETCIHP